MKKRHSIAWFLGVPRRSANIRTFRGSDRDAVCRSVFGHTARRWGVAGGLVEAVVPSPELGNVLDKLRLNEGSPSERRFFAFLQDAYPELEGRYRALVANGTDPYYEELEHRYDADPRVKFVFGDPSAS